MKEVNWLNSFKKKKKEEEEEKEKKKMMKMKIFDSWKRKICEITFV